MSAWCLGVSAALAVAFAFIGFYEEATKTTLFSSKLASVNEIHSYFVVNSVFYDSNIFGRYMALVMVLLVALLLYDRRPRLLIGVTVTLAIVWGGLVLALSRSSLLALLAGMGTLAAVRWHAGKRVLGVTAVVVVAGAIALAASPTTFGLNQGLNGASSGRANLVTGGLSMFAGRPVWGYGSGSFGTEYHRRYPSSVLTASHTIPITVAAEQGLIGLLVYLALVISALLALFREVRSDPVRPGGHSGVRGAAGAHDALRGVPGGPADLDAARDRLGADHCLEPAPDGRAAGDRAAQRAARVVQVE